MKGPIAGWLCVEAGGGGASESGVGVALSEGGWEIPLLIWAAEGAGVVLEGAVARKG